jgi:hypothetical protein
MACAGLAAPFPNLLEAAAGSVPWERCSVCDTVGVRASAQMPGAVKDFVHVDLEVRMGTDPYAFRRYWLEDCALPPGMKRLRRS